MKYLLTAILSLAAVSLFIGCDRSPKTPHDQTILKVNGIRFTTGMLDSEVALKSSLYRNRQRTKDVNGVEAEKQKIRRGILAKKIDELIMLDLINKKTTKADPEILDKVRKNYVKTFGSPKQDFESFCKLLDDCLLEELNRRISDTARMETFFKNVHLSELDVSEELVDRTISDMRHGDELAHATNVLIYATASNVWRRAVAGEDFNSLADEFNMEEGANPGGDLGDNCMSVDFSCEEPELWQTLSSLKPGEITPPLNTTEGLAIYKMFSSTNETGKAEDLTCHLARIVFHRALFFDKYVNDQGQYDRNQVRRDLAADLRAKLQVKLITEGRKLASVQIQTNTPYFTRRQIDSIKRAYRSVSEEVIR